MKTRHFIAFDLGATSGRAIIGSVGDGSLTTREIHRFDNPILHVGDHYYWDIFALFEELKKGLACAARTGLEFTSIGIDTWGVDFACVAPDGMIAAMPLSYRDPYTDRWCRHYLDNVVPRRALYDRTGIQILPFNSLFQLHAMRSCNMSQREVASRLLFMPDALAYLLTGRMVTEYTIASTSQLLDVHRRTFCSELLAGVGLTTGHFAPMVEPGTCIGTLTEAVARDTGMARLPVIAVAGHDTASAVAAIPATNAHFAYLSSGTWSLMGIETSAPVVNDTTYSMNISNEGGVEGTIRLLKNITGMWLLEECRRRWRQEGIDYDYPAIVAMAGEVTPHERLIDPDDAAFAHPADMPAAIAEYLAATGQPQATTHAHLVRCIFDSLALKYRAVLDVFARLAPHPIDCLHVIGGGSRNELLSQMTACATGIPVVAGPAEATAIGNIMLQARAAGMAGSLQEMRRIIAASIVTRRYEPGDTPAWEAAYKKFCHVTNN